MKFRLKNPDFIRISVLHNPMIFSASFLPHPMLLSFHKRRRLFPIITTAIKFDKRQRSHVCSFRHFNQPCETRPIIPQQSLPDPQSQAEPMSASFRGMQAPSKCLKIVDQTITQDFFNYTSGRWIYNERQQLDARRIDFSVPALKQAASAVMGMSECIEMINFPKDYSIVRSS
jgi:hypothetical protein